MEVFRPVDHDFYGYFDARHRLDTFSDYIVPTFVELRSFASKSLQ